jgi:peptide/nickel transport system permease protein
VSFRRFFLVRLAWALAAVFLATIVVFSMFRLLIGHPPPGTVGNKAEFRRRYEPYYDRDRLFLVRYGEFIRDFGSDGSLGRSHRWRKDTRSVALEAIPVTLSVVLPALALALAVAVPFSLLWARAGPKPSRLWRLPIDLAASAIPIWVALWLAFYVGFKLEWLPIQGYCDVFNPGNECGGATEWAKHLVLPWISFAPFFAAVYARGLLGVVSGIRKAEAEDRAALTRRSVLGMARTLGRDFGFAVGAAVVLEVIFGLPGVGRTLFVGLASFDLRVAETVLLWAALLAIAVHFLADVIVCALDADLRAEWPFSYARPASGESA